MLRMFDAENRARRFTNYLFRRTTQQDMRQPGTTMRGDNDHIHYDQNHILKVAHRSTADTARASLKKDGVDRKIHWAEGKESGIYHTFLVIVLIVLLIRWPGWGNVLVTMAYTPLSYVLFQGG